MDSHEGGSIIEPKLVDGVKQVPNLPAAVDDKCFKGLKRQDADKYQCTAYESIQTIPEKLSNDQLAECQRQESKAKQLSERTKSLQDLVRKVEEKFTEFNTFKAVKEANERLDLLELDVLIAHSSALGNLTRAEKQIRNLIGEFRSSTQDHEPARTAEMIESCKQIQELIKKWNDYFSSFDATASDAEIEEAHEAAERSVSQIQLMKTQILNELTKGRWLEFKINNSILESLNRLGELVEVKVGDESRENAQNLTSYNPAEYEQSLQIFKESMALRKINAVKPDNTDLAKSLLHVGPVHPTPENQSDSNIPKNLQHLAIMRHLEGNHNEAAKLFKASLDMYQRIHADQPDQTVIANNLEYLAYTYYLMGDNEKSEELHRDCLDMRRRIHEQRDHIEIAQSASFLAHVSYLRGNTVKAIRYHQEAVELYKRIHCDQPDHVNVASNLHSLGNDYVQLGVAEEAIKFLEQASKMYERIYKDQGDHKDLACSLNDLGRAHHLGGNQEKANELFMASSQMYRRIYPVHPVNPIISGVSGS